MAKKLKFPERFYWGASTSSHQVEGGNKNDWTEWEKENAERLAEEAKHHWYLWQLELFPEALLPENYISGDAAGHYAKYEGDFDIAKKLGHNAHRLSIEWSRIEPKEGEFDEDEIEHYKEVLSALKERGIEPFVTLWHFTLPTWVRDEGGWTNRKTANYFARYATRVVKELSPYVSYWITINEPMVYAGAAYFHGTWPPQKMSLFSHVRVIHNLISGHRFAYNAMRVVDSGAIVGVAKNNVYFEAADKNFINRLLKRIADWWWNFYFLNNVKKHIDFIGLNHYAHNLVKYGFNKNEDREISDLGWEIYPESIYYAVRNLKRYKTPIVVTENGLADAGDTKRPNFIANNLRYLHKAIEDGADVKGYLHWSLLDNFEWDKGFWPRFGLVEVDYKTQKRKIRESAKEYTKIIKDNAVEAPS